MRRSAEKKKILIVDDEPPILKLLAETLRSEGYRVFVARDGEEGLRVALAETPHLILLDIVMPRMTGNAMYRALSESAWGKTVPVIFLTNLPPNEAHRKSVPRGRAVQYLVKTDWRLDDVLDAVKRTLREHPVAAQSVVP